MLGLIFFAVCLAIVSLTGHIVSGQISRKCLQCICNVESECKPLNCSYDVNGDACGYYQIHYDYYIDCGKPRPSNPCDDDKDCWEKCSKDKECASICVKRYIRRYHSRAGCGSDCESYARLHNGGPQGCKNSKTDRYWEMVRTKGCYRYS